MNIDLNLSRLELNTIRDDNQTIAAYQWKSKTSGRVSLSPIEVDSVRWSVSRKNKEKQLDSTLLFKVKIRRRGKTIPLFSRATRVDLEWSVTIDSSDAWGISFWTKIEGVVALYSNRRVVFSVRIDCVSAWVAPVLLLRTKGLHSSLSSLYCAQRKVTEAKIAISFLQSRLKDCNQTRTRLW